MRQLFGGGPQYNRAAEWAHRGRPAAPHPGAIVVWAHHVGRIIGGCHSGRCLVNSGNDGHAVRTRMRSIRGVIAIRSI